jgi:hypothetical protein
LTKFCLFKFVPPDCLAGHGTKRRSSDASHGQNDRISDSTMEGTANFLVNRRMNKSQQMRWSRRGADLLLQVRCAGFSGKLGSS